jgi:hypothetical protein
MDVNLFSQSILLDISLSFVVKNAQIPVYRWSFFYRKRYVILESTRNCPQIPYEILESPTFMATRQLMKGSGAGAQGWHIPPYAKIQLFLNLLKKVGGKNIVLPPTLSLRPTFWSTLKACPSFSSPLTKHPIHNVILSGSTPILRQQI